MSFAELKYYSYGVCNFAHAMLFSSLSFAAEQESDHPEG